MRTGRTRNSRTSRITEGQKVAERIAGEDPTPIDYKNIPHVIYCQPEVAAVGLTEAKAKELGMDVVTKRYPFSANARALMLGGGQGFVKTIAEKDGAVVGVHIIGPRASDLISEAMLVTTWEAYPAELGELMHPHPTLSEVIGETFLRSRRQAAPRLITRALIGRSHPATHQDSRDARPCDVGQERRSRPRSKPAPMSSASTSLTGAAPNTASRSRTRASRRASSGGPSVCSPICPGPRCAPGPIAGGEVVLETGTEFILTSGDIEGDQHRVTTTVANLSEFVQKDDEIFLADGQIVLLVKKVKGPDVITEVVRRGFLRSRKGMHIPRAERKVQAFTSEDKAALDYAIRLKVDYVGLSFVRDATDCERAAMALPETRSPSADRGQDRDQERRRPPG